MDDRERHIAIREAEQIHSSTEYFDARPHLTSMESRRVFDAGFVRGFDAATERLRAAQPANQCDGCARNLPVEDGRHVDRFGMPVMACQAHRYSKPAQPAVPEDRLMQQFDSWWEQHGEYLRAGGGNYERTFAWHAWRESAKQASPAQPAVPVESQEIFPGTTEALNKLSVLPSKDQP